MGETNKSIRIRTTPGGSDKYVTVKIEQEFDFLEILSLKISQEELYRNFCADYGVVVGRVITNKGFGVPNAKVSVFTPITSEDEKNDLIRDLYPYKTPADKNKNFIRYNLLLSKATCELNKAVGTFPTKEEVLNNNIVLDVYDRYYKFTTKTNAAGDYMIFGVPVGERTIHMDTDLSDIGAISVRPYDLIAEGAPENLFESTTEYKTSTDLDSLAQIRTNNKGIDVIPFWGEQDTCEIGITRVDFDLNYTIKPNSLFTGSIFSDSGKNSMNKRCNPKNNMGEQDELRTGAGRIEMIRASRINPVTWVQDGEVEAIELETFTIEGGDLIDDDGTFAFPVPMNIGHMITDEFGNLVPSGDPDIGVATKGYYRFKLNLNEPPANLKRRTGHMIFPSLSTYHGGSAGFVSTGNPADIGGTEDQRFTDTLSDYKDPDKDFHLFEWKQLYSIAQYMKKYKKGTNRFSYLGIKNTDVSGETNLFPYNNAVYKFDILFVIMQAFVNFIGMLIKFLVILTGLQLTFSIGGNLSILGVDVWNFCNWFGVRPFYFLSKLFPKFKDQDPVCPAYADSEDRGFVLPCEDNNYCVNMSNPCPTGGPNCGQGCNDIVDGGTAGTTGGIENSDNGTICSGDECNCGDTAIYFKVNFFVPDETTCTAIDTVEAWKCCVIYNLAENRNVIRRTFLDGWVFGTSYLFQFKYKKRLKSNGTIKEKFCGPGSDHSGGDNYHKNQCCSNASATSGCDKCLVRGPGDSKDINITPIGPYHHDYHNQTVNGNCSGQNCGNGATDIGDIIYCNSYSSTKIVSLGRLEMCPDTLNEIGKCINAQNCTIDIYKQDPTFYTGTFYENGWDPEFWINGIGPTSYQDPREVMLFLMYLTGCKVKDLFNKDNSCHERELKDESGEEYYKLVREVSKIQTEVLLTEDTSGNSTFDPTIGVNVATGEGSGFLFDSQFGQRFHPCVNNGDCYTPPAPWAPTTVVLTTLVSDGQSNNVFGGNHNASKNIPYYYFGIHPGKTAIEKLRKEFFLNS